MLTSGFIVLASLVILETQLISSASAEVTFLNKWGSYGVGNGQFDQFLGDVAVADTGQVYVVETKDLRIHRFFDSNAWLSGTNTFLDGSGPTNVAVGSGEILGALLTLDSAKGLVVGDTTAINVGGSLWIDGGSLTTGSFDNSEQGTLNFHDGTLTVNGAGGVFDPGNPTTFTIDGSTATVNLLIRRFKSSMARIIIIPGTYS